MATTTLPVPAVELNEKIGLEEQINIDDNEAVVSDNPGKIYEEYDMLRSKCPVAWTNRYNGFWLLTKYVLSHHSSTIALAGRCERIREEKLTET